MILGTVAGKRMLDRISDRAFRVLVEAMLLVAGLNFLLRG